MSTAHLPAASSPCVSKQFRIPWDKLEYQEIKNDEGYTMGHRTVKVGAEEIVVELTVNFDELMAKMLHRLRYSKRGKSVLAEGAVVAQVIKRRDLPS